MKILVTIALIALVITPSYAKPKLVRKSEGKFTIRTSIAGKPIRQDVYYCAPRRPKDDIKVLIVMHGNSRNADGYRDSWQKYAEEENLLVLVPEFSDRNFPGSSSYNLAGMVDKRGVATKKDQWAFSLIDNLFLEVKKDLKFNSNRFYFYGHSAGAQFVHRYVMFHPSDKLGLAIAANAGWYTFPTEVGSFPYALGKYSKYYDAKNVFSINMTVLLGSEDTDPNHKYLRKTKEALMQGRHRFERGQNYFKLSKKLAEDSNLEFNWKFTIVPDIGHSNSGMCKSALKIILNTKI